MRILYDKDDKVEFVEFLGGVDGMLKPVIYGVSAFDTNAETLMELLTQKNAGVVRNAEHWATIGFGVAGYYER